MNFKESVKHILNTRYINEEEMEEDGGEASCKTKCSKCGKSKCKCSTETKEKSKDLAGEKTPEEKEMLELMKKARKSVSTKTSGGDDDDDGYPRSVATGGDGDDSVTEGFDFAAYDIGQKEQEVMAQVALGKSNREIAETLFLSEGTVRNYISSVLEKLSLRDRTQLAVFYLNKVVK